MRIDEDNYGIIDRAEKILFTEYKKHWFDAENIDGYIDDYEILSIIENLCDEIERLQEPKNEINDYPNEERDREREELGI